MMGTLKTEPAGPDPTCWRRRWPPRWRSGRRRRPLNIDDVLVAPIDATLADTAAFCAAYEVGLDVSANCVVIAGKREGEIRYAACVVLATTRADVNGVVRRALDVRKASFAPMADADEGDRDGVRRDHPDRAAGVVADPGRRPGDRHPARDHRLRRTAQQDRHPRAGARRAAGARGVVEGLARPA